MGASQIPKTKIKGIAASNPTTQSVASSQRLTAKRPLNGEKTAIAWPWYANTSVVENKETLSARYRKVKTVAANEIPRFARIFQPQTST